MSFQEWWSGMSRVSRNMTALFLFDVLLLAGALAGTTGLQALWEVLAEFTPNVFLPLIAQLIAAIRGVSPGSVVVSGLALSYFTAFGTLVVLHLSVGAGIGFLFDHTKPTPFWSAVNYFVLLLILFVLHLFLVLRQSVFIF